eukprot:TRINITY_DN40814_c0_g1_i1.p1 TRINITY_DN40814_c0_g1~~TRINITY_DN40814_c0_g1_i1.p1  ORF type:complete len:310 (-),score=1.00 TRINITY_DN40814_c0_g1_i1:204-1133(-)
MGPADGEVSTDVQLTGGAKVAPAKVSICGVFYLHLLDWITLIILIGGGVALDAIYPFQRYIDSTQMQDHMFPLKDNSIPFYVVPAYAILLPLIVFAVSFAVRRDFFDLHHSVLGLLYSLALSFVITNALKVSIGRPRPDFFWRCFPSGKAVYGSDGNAMCNGEYDVVREGRLSFPSGHSSMSFAGLTTLALFLTAKLFTFAPKGRGQLARLLLPGCCLAGAVAVAVTRVDDYWHFPFDVFIGALIGMATASVCHFMHYPALVHDYCDVLRIELGSNPLYCELSCCGSKSLEEPQEHLESSTPPPQPQGV